MLEWEVICVWRLAKPRYKQRGAFRYLSKNSYSENFIFFCFWWLDLGELLSLWNNSKISKISSYWTSFYWWTRSVPICFDCLLDHLFAADQRSTFAFPIYYSTQHYFALPCIWIVFLLFFFLFNTNFIISYIIKI